LAENEAEKPDHKSLNRKERKKIQQAERKQRIENEKAAQK